MLRYCFLNKIRSRVLKVVRVRWLMRLGNPPNYTVCVCVCVWITLKIEIIVTFVEKLNITGYDYDYGVDTLNEICKHTYVSLFFRFTVKTQVSYKQLYF